MARKLQKVKLGTQYQASDLPPQILLDAVSASASAYGSAASEQFVRVDVDAAAEAAAAAVKPAAAGNKRKGKKVASKSAATQERSVHVDEAVLRTAQLGPALPAPWTEEERAAFDKGMATHGRNLRRVAEVVASRPVSEVIRFYYGEWKHSKSHAKWTKGPKDRLMRAAVKAEATRLTAAAEARQALAADEGAWANAVQCKACGRGGELLLCDTCSNSYHIQCLVPALEQPPTGAWSCPECDKTSKSAVRPMLVEAAVGTRVDARYYGGDEIFPAVVHAVNAEDGTFDVRYDDGEVERFCKPTAVAYPGMMPELPDPYAAPAPGGEGGADDGGGGGGDDEQGHRKGAGAGKGARGGKSSAAGSNSKAGSDAGKGSRGGGASAGSGKASGKAGSKAGGKAGGKASGKASGKAGGKAGGKTSGKAGGKAGGKTSGKASGGGSGGGKGTPASPKPAGRGGNG
eukprot:g3142.t1